MLDLVILAVSVILAVWLILDERTEFGRVSRTSLLTIGIFTVALCTVPYRIHVQQVHQAMHSTYLLEIREWKKAHPGEVPHLPIPRSDFPAPPLGPAALMAIAVVIYTQGRRVVGLKRVPLSAILLSLVTVAIVCYALFVWNNLL